MNRRAWFKKQKNDNNFWYYCRSIYVTVGTAIMLWVLRCKMMVRRELKPIVNLSYFIEIARSKLSAWYGVQLKYRIKFANGLTCYYWNVSIDPCSTVFSSYMAFPDYVSFSIRHLRLLKLCSRVRYLICIFTKYGYGTLDEINFIVRKFDVKELSTCSKICFLNVQGNFLYFLSS